MGFYFFSWLTQIWLLSSPFLLLWIVLRLLNCCAVDWWRLKCFFACRKCALSGLPRTCKHRIMLGDSGKYYYISPSCRARVSPSHSQCASALQQCSKPWHGDALEGQPSNWQETCGTRVCSWSQGGSWSMTRVPVSSPASHSGALPYVASGDLSSVCSLFHGLIQYRALIVLLYYYVLILLYKTQ